MATGRIVIIEDEADIVEVMSYNLSREGFDVFAYSDGESGRKGVRERMPDLVLLDLMLPEMDGLEVCRRIRESRRTARIPVIMVTAKGEESDLVLGLGMGADDYITKPFSPKELVARVKAVLRRAEREGSEGIGEPLERGGIIVDPERHEVCVDGEPVDFTRAEFLLLYALIAHPGRVFSRQILIERIGDGSIVADRTIDVHINSIRKKLGSHRDRVETIRGVGYKFIDSP